MIYCNQRFNYNHASHILQYRLDCCIGPVHSRLPVRTENLDFKFRAACGASCAAATSETIIALQDLYNEVYIKPPTPQGVLFLGKHNIRTLYKMEWSII
jgi:hypothetical protein